MREYLVKLREKNGQTQQDVASAIGITRQYYQQIETGDRQKRMDVTLITKLADHFRVPLGVFISFEQSNYNTKIVP